MLKNFFTMGMVVGSLLVGANARAATYEGCGLSSPLKSRNSAGTLVSARSVFPEGVVPSIIATSPSNVVVLLIPSGSDWTERPLYWPTPTDPTYDYRKMRKLPSDTVLVANDYAQRIEVLRAETAFSVDGVVTTYTPLNYNGFTLTIDGCGGNDNLRGGEGSDYLYDYSGAGNEMRSFGGRDRIEGLAVFMSGGDGDDCLYGLGSSIDMKGEAGNDRLDADPGFASTRNDGGLGTDTCSAIVHLACEETAPTPDKCASWL